MPIAGAITCQEDGQGIPDTPASLKNLSFLDLRELFSWSCPTTVQKVVFETLHFLQGGLESPSEGKIAREHRPQSCVTVLVAMGKNLGMKEREHYDIVPDSGRSQGGTD